MLIKLTLFLALLIKGALSAEVPGQVESLPEPGIQPQVVVTARGVVHLIYLKGDPKACDIRHAVRPVAGGKWSPPVTVNSKPRSAIGIGTIRGAQIALGKDDSVQVVWNGSSVAKPHEAGQTPLLYARLDPGAKAFSAQQNLLGDTTALDGGASIAANHKGRVALVWHASPPGTTEEAARLVWVRYSDDDGRTFSGPTPLNTDQPGVCACCSLRAQLDAGGNLSVLFRSAASPTERGMWLIEAKAAQSTLTKLDDWHVSTCPMSSASFLASGPVLRAAWENDGHIVTGIPGGSPAPQKIGPKHSKHPSLARNAKGQTLIVSITGSGWSKAGTLHWDLLDPNGNISATGDGDALPVWSHPAVYARPDGGFVVLQ